MKKNGKFMGNQPSKQNACAYCHNGLHQGYMTQKMVKQHECCAKQCPHLEKFESHPYWVEKARIKAEKKARKDAEKNMLIAV